MKQITPEELATEPQKYLNFAGSQHSHSEYIIQVSDNQSLLLTADWEKAHSVDTHAQIKLQGTQGKALSKAMERALQAGKEEKMTVFTTKSQRNYANAYPGYGRTENNTVYLIPQGHN